MNFDLNISNYNISDLEEMFGLQQNYDANNIEYNMNKLKTSINNNKNIDKESNEKINNFLITAANILINRNTISEKKNDYYKPEDFKMKSIAVSKNDHDVQDREKSQYVVNYNNDYVSGIVNPIKKTTIINNLVINSCFRDNYFSSLSTDFLVNLPITFNNVLSMELLDINIPNTYFIISKKLNNNYFYITANSVTQKIEIADGNYSNDGLLQLINQNVQILGGDFANIVFLLNDTNLNGSGQVMIGIKNGETEFPFSLNFLLDKNGNNDRNTPLPLKFGWLLGFRNGVYENNLNYVSEGIIDLKGPKYLYLVIDDFNNNVNNGFYSAFNSSLLNKNIIAQININNNYVFENLHLNNFNSIVRQYFGPVNFNKLHIQILDEYGRIINLNNMDFYFSLKLTIDYDI
jgi:hypothetical protein